MSYQLNRIISGGLALAPFTLAVAAVLLATPAVLIGLALAAALFNDAAGYGVLGAVVYSPLLLALGGGAIVRWYRRRGRGSWRPL